MKSLSTCCTIAVLLLSAWVAAPPLRAQTPPFTIQTFTFTSPQDGAFVFPRDTSRFEKILMHYKLRCPFGGQCGEWDYLEYINLYQKTGRIDSKLRSASNYTVEDTLPDPVRYMKSPSWNYFPTIRRVLTRIDTTSITTAAVGTGIVELPSPFAVASHVAHSQFLWKVAELKTAGLTAGNISGMRLDVGLQGTAMRNLMIRLKGTKLDSLTAAGYENVGLGTVYSVDHFTPKAGWNSFNFPDGFIWDGSSNIVVDISFDDDGAETSFGSTVKAENTTFSSGIMASGRNGMLHFEGKDYVTVPAGAFSPVDSAITIGFWQYGNSKFQPQQQSIFEGLDSLGRRVINAHLPWSDSSVYWDAGAGGSYDRVNKLAKYADFAGKWNYWVFTKNVKTGYMRIYLNGVAWAAASGKKKTMEGISKFRIGSAGDGTSNYDGNIDEFAVWNAEVDAATIKAWMNKDLNASHPFAANLRLYYKFGDAGMTRTADSSGHGYDGYMAGPPERSIVAGADIFRNFFSLKARPNVVFERWTGRSRADTIVTVDSVEHAPYQVVFYRDQAHPASPTDTLTVWPTYSRNYKYDKLGHVIDSTSVAPDSTLHLVKIPYYEKFEVTNKFELGRYITPYGNGLNLGEGFTWTYDVTDYKTLLHDTVHLSAGNGQELVDLSFEFFPGVPPRDPVSITNVWNGGPSYGTSTPISNFLTRKKVKIDGPNVRFKLRTTGHGFGGTENCSEFCPKIHSITVNGTKKFDTLVWRNDCGLNPVYPQGGTWLYNRSNWCPGSDVPTYDLEITPYVTQGDSASFDYSIENYTWNGQGSTPYYDIETQVVSYSKPNFVLDAAVEHIKSPSKTDLYRRMNPICSNPIVTIKNTGSTPLTALTITYGIAGAKQSTFTWTGHLDFLQTEDVELGSFEWAGGNAPFQVSVSAPNNGADQYANNDIMQSAYDFPPQYPSNVIFELKTNAQGADNSYVIRDAVGNVVFERNNLDGNTTYKDSLNLPNGCYEFRLVDQGGDGLSWWANPDAGNGFMRLRNGANGGLIKTFNPDFGTEIYQQFTVGYYLADADEPAAEKSHVSVFPNPTTGEFTVDLAMAKHEDLTIAVTNVLGRTIYQRAFKNMLADHVNLDLAGNPAGLYFVTVKSAEGTITRKIVLN
ncbi:MAG: peptide-N-glycosidase F-related protein [Candidatus Kapaibacterium sp.]